ncbi:hypothetical protein Tco_1555136 [Tanacetum coccineum]
MVERKVHGDHITQYTQLRQYVLELKERNPDTTVKIEVKRDYEPDSMDGCFMSGPFPLQILAAVGVDPNYGIYPLVYWYGFIKKGQKQGQIGQNRAREWNEREKMKPKYSINHQEDLNQQWISDVHVRWDKIVESQNELLNMIQSFCEMVIQQRQAANIDQSPPQEMSIQEMEDLKHQYLDEMQSISNQIQIKDYRNEKIDIRYRRECEIMIDELTGKFNGMSIEINKKKELRLLEQAANLSTYTTEPSRRFNSFYDDDDYEASTIPLNDIISQIPPITPVLPTLEPEDSLIMGNEELSTIPEKESDELIKSSFEDLVSIPSESEDTFESDGGCNLSSCEDFSPINVSEEKSVTFSNPLFDSNDDFTSSDDELLSDEDVPEDTVKIYSNPLFEFDDEYISSDVNPLFNEVLEDIESEDSYVSKLDEPDLLVTPLSKLNEDECFNPGGDVDEIELLLHRDPSTPKISVDSILEGFNDEPPLEENDDLYDLESKENEWKKILYDAPIDDLMTEDKVFDLGIPEKFFSPTYVSLPFEDRHYLSLTYVIRIFLPYLTYSMDSSLPLSSGSEDIIFDPDISALSFYSLEPVDCPDYEDSRARGTDISKITRKPSKTGKHGHEERKSTKEARDAKPKAGKVKKSKPWSTWVNKVKSLEDKTPKYFKSTLQVSKVTY